MGEILVSSAGGVRFNLQKLIFFPTYFMDFFAHFGLIWIFKQTLGQVTFVLMIAC
jgi:hypothetical protein